MFTVTRGLCLSVAIGLACAPVRAADLNKYLPENTEIVVGIDVTSVLESGLVQKHVPELLRRYGGDLLQFVAQASGQKIDDDVMKTCTKNLADSAVVRKWINDNKSVIRRVEIGTGADLDDDTAFVVLEGKFDKNRLKAMLDELATFKTLGIVIKGMKTGTHEYYRVKMPGNNGELFVALADANTILCCQDMKLLLKALEHADRKSPAVRKELIEVANQIDPKANLWIVAAPKEADEFVAAHGSVVVTDGIRLVAAVTSKDAEAARNLASDMKASLQETVEDLDDARKILAPLGIVCDLLKKIEPLAVKNVVNVEVVLPGATLDKQIKDLPTGKN